MTNSETNTVGAILAFFLALILSSTVHAADNGFTLVVACTEKGVPETSATKVEIYIPDRLCCDGYDGLLKGLQNKQKGYYALDLTGAGKGKPLEPVHLQISRRPAGLLVTQHTRGLPPTLVPRNGGTVSFDKRFAVGLACKALFDTSKLE